MRRELPISQAARTHFRNPVTPGSEPFWLRVMDVVGRSGPPAVIGAGVAATAINARNYVNLLAIAGRVAPVAEEMLELAVPMLGGED